MFELWLNCLVQFQALNRQKVGAESGDYLKGGQSETIGSCAEADSNLTGVACKIGCVRWIWSTEGNEAIQKSSSTAGNTALAAGRDLRIAQEVVAFIKETFVSLSCKILVITWGLNGKCRRRMKGLSLAHLLSLLYCTQIMNESVIFEQAPSGQGRLIVRLQESKVLDYL